MCADLIIVRQSTKMPFVFVLGNHSSGKSSFINYVLGRNIQTAGVAPTDDRCVCVCLVYSFQLVLSLEKGIHGSTAV